MKKNDKDAVGLCVQDVGKVMGSSIAKLTGNRTDEPKEMSETVQ
jgi:hypothetical protein